MEKPIDLLTGLISGVELQTEMSALIAKGGEFSLITLDIDMLSAINREYGLDAGDSIFRVIAENIKKLFPEPCTAFRDIRDQFDILLPDSSKEEAFLKAEELRKFVYEAKLDFKSAEGADLKQSISAGVSSFPEDGNRPADIIRRANSALARAKKGGRNTVCLARDEKLIPKTSHYTQAQLEGLSVISDKLGVGEAGLLREALDDLLKKYDMEDASFNFEDIVNLRGDVIFELVKKADKKMLALALMGASPTLREKVFSVAGEAMASEIGGLMESPAPITEVEAAQKGIVGLAFVN